jgi:hypothetical protein
MEFIIENWYLIIFGLILFFLNSRLDKDERAIANEIIRLADDDTVGKARLQYTLSTYLRSIMLTLLFIAAVVFFD